MFIKKVGDAIVLIPYHAPWKTLVDSLQLFTVDFMEDREQPSIQDREDVFSKDICVSSIYLYLLCKAKTKASD